MEGRWETTKREESACEAAPKRLVLRWVWPKAAVVPLQGARLRVGRDQNAEVRLHGPAVSRYHAELYRQGPLYVLHDLASTNGTWLGGKRVGHAPVTPGSVVRVGDWVGVFTLEHVGDPGFGELAPGVFGGRELAEALSPIAHGVPPRLPVLLVGATGTGKERVARAVHHFSQRQGPFFAVNCAALPEHLAEAELFGYRRGAFTGAERASTGHFRAAEGGTLFLDETAELSLPMQAKLLRVLDDRQVLGLGESAPVTVDVHVVTAVQRPLAELVASKLFREDLAARLSGLELGLPSLSARRADIAPLFWQFLNQECGGHPLDVEARLVEALCLHDWPQNIRELELVTRALVAVHGSAPILRQEHLPNSFRRRSAKDRASEHPSTPPQERREFDLSRVQAELRQNGGNVKAAAQSLGVSRQRIYRVLAGESPEELIVSSESRGTSNGASG